MRNTLPRLLPALLAGIFAAVISSCATSDEQGELPAAHESEARPADHAQPVDPVRAEEADALLARWRNADEDERHSLVEPLERSFLREGLTVDEVRAALGVPFSQRRWWSFSLGSKQGGSGLHSHKLQFSDEDRELLASIGTWPPEGEPEWDHGPPELSQRKIEALREEIDADFVSAWVNSPAESRAVAAGSVRDWIVHCRPDPFVFLALVDGADEVGEEWLYRPPRMAFEQSVGVREYMRLEFLDGELVDWYCRH